ncbi:hypothetical protein Tco_1342880 [Tanacetum coccineum]
MQRTPLHQRFPTHKKEGKTLEEAYYTQFSAPFQGGGYQATAPGFYQRNNANSSYREQRQSMEETLSKFMGESAKRHEENSNMIKEIRASTDVAIRNQGASIKTLDIQIGIVKYPKGIAENVQVGIELRRDQVDDLMLIVKEGEVFEGVKAMNDARMVSKVFGYHSDYDQSEKIRIDCAHNLKFSCMIVVEDMDLYIDEGMGEVVVGKPFYEVSCVETKRFDGIITIYENDESVTY